MNEREPLQQLTLQFPSGDGKERGKEGRNERKKQGGQKGMEEGKEGERPWFKLIAYAILTPNGSQS